MSTPTNEVEAAQGRLEELKSQMAAGGNVTQKQWTDARAALEFAQMRAEAGEQARLAQAEAEHRARLDALRDRLSTEFNALEIDALRSHMAEAVEAYVAAASAWNKRLEAARKELEALQPFEHDEADTHYQRTGVRVGAVNVLRQRPQCELKKVVFPILSQHAGRGRVSVDNPQD